MSYSKDGVVWERPAVTPHLVVGGAAKALDFYKEAFGAVETFRMPTPDGRLMHASIKIGGGHIMLCDEFPEMTCPGPKTGSPLTLGGSSITIHLNVDDVDASFNQAVAAGATAVMPPADMFWGDRYAQVVDPFGHRWSLSTPVPGGARSKEEMAESVAEICAEPQPA